MYHISKDKRAVQSAELIYDGFLQCLNHKSFEQITVTDVQKAAGVARTTIYRCFDNLSDILYWRCDLCFREALCSVQPTDSPSELDLMRGYFAYWTEHGDILKLLVKINRQDIIYACHLKNAKDLEQSYGELPGMDEVNARYFMALRTGVTISILKAWSDGGYKETSQDLTQILQKQIEFMVSAFENNYNLLPHGETLRNNL